MQALLDKNSKVAVISAVLDKRENIKAALSELGYANITCFENHKEFIEHHLSQGFAWVIANVQTDQPVNVLHLLDKIIREKSCQGTRVSLLVEPEDRACVPLAFERGLLSWHVHYFAKKALVEMFQDFFAIANKYHGSEVKVASHYLQNFLLQERLVESSLFLANQLIDYLVDDTEMLLSLAQANVNSGNFGQAKILLQQARFLNPNFVQDCKRLEKDIQEKQAVTGVSADEKGPSAMVQFNTCVIIEPDDNVSFFVESLLAELGVKNIRRFDDPEQAWDWLKAHPEPDLILHEWKLPKISGVALIQRIRSHGFNKVLLIVMSGIVKSEDLPILNEMSVANIIAKPFGKKEFFLSLRWTMIQQAVPTEQKVLERTITTLLANGKYDEALQHKAAYLANPKITTGRKTLMMARFLYAKGQFDAAKDKTIEAIRLSGNEPLECVNLLGRCLLKLTDHLAALKFLEKAQALSPKNISRLCEIAEIQMERGMIDSAKDAVAMAKQIDSGNQEALDTEAKVAVTSKDFELAKKLIAQVGSKVELAAYMNNKAIAQIRSGKTDDALQLYAQALDCIPASESGLQSVLHYNSGLAHARKGNLPAAEIDLEKAAANGANPVVNRARSLLKRIKTARNQKQPLHLASINYATDDEDDLSFETFLGEKPKDAPAQEQAVGPKAGQLCLYGIYTKQEANDKLSLDLLQALQTPVGIKKVA